MKTAVVVLATGEYWQGAKVLFHTLRKYGGLPNSIDTVALGMDKCDFALAAPIDADYSWIPVSQTNFPNVANKFHAFTLGYDRVIMLDADMLCVGDCSLLWSERLSSMPFYACRDTAAVKYYPKVLSRLKLKDSLVINAGTMVFNHFNPHGIFNDIRKGVIEAYDGGDQGYINDYFQKRNIEFGFLPPEYNSTFDCNMPSIPEHTMRIVHYAGSNFNPWAPLNETSMSNLRRRYLQRWRDEYKDATK